jgi:hypothetical protein
MRLELSKITNADLQLRSTYQTIFAGTKLRVTFGPIEELGNKAMMDQVHRDLAQMKAAMLTEWNRIYLDPAGTYSGLTLNFCVGATCQTIEDTGHHASSWDMSGQLTGSNSFISGAVLRRMPDGVRNLFSSEPTQVPLHVMTIQYNKMPTYWDAKHSNERNERLLLPLRQC